MWTRGELKTRAKGVLKLLYWKAFLISLLLMMAGGRNGINFNINNNNNNFNFNTNHLNFNSNNISFNNINFLSNWGINLNSINNIRRNGIISINPVDIINYLPLAFLILFGAILTGAVLFRVLLGYNLEVGGRRFFIKAATDKTSQMEAIAHTFKMDRYINVIKTMLYKAVLIFLWSLLLVIPGIVKGYAYRMVPFILAENPQIDYKRAVELSNQMTMGQKLDIFVLDLSFIGWYILGALAFGIGIIFVAPYVDTTNAELYLELRHKALSEGLVTLDELVAE